MLNLDLFPPSSVTCSFSSGSTLNRAPSEYHALHKAVILAVRLSLLCPKLFQFRTVLDCLGQLPWFLHKNGVNLPGPAGSSLTGYFRVHNWFRTDTGCSNISMPVHPTPTSGSFYLVAHQTRTLLARRDPQRVTPNWDDTTLVHNEQHAPNWRTEQPDLFVLSFNGLCSRNLVTPEYMDLLF